jgi:hypothetical protein
MNPVFGRGGYVWSGTSRIVVKENVMLILVVASEFT